MDNQLDLFTQSQILKCDDEEFMEYLEVYKETANKLLSAKIALDELKEMQKRFKDIDIELTKEQIKELEIQIDKLDYSLNCIKRMVILY